MDSHISFEQLESESFSFYNMEEEAISVTTLEELLQNKVTFYEGIEIIHLVLKEKDGK
ncbi:unnamed protein product [Citrullus colocynthis]|uniref:Uncharacterized protein n=1 Tax=Citrullus colocynthis TaxID=252529 RepID=A0ABP0YEX5_9ROSI